MKLPFIDGSSLVIYQSISAQPPELNGHPGCHVVHGETERGNWTGVGTVFGEESPAPVMLHQVINRQPTGPSDVLVDPTMSHWG